MCAFIPPQPWPLSLCTLRSCPICCTDGWWIRDHWFRGYAGTVSCCCDWSKLRGLTNRCDYRRYVSESEAGSCRDANENHGMGYEDGCASPMRFKQRTHNSHFQLPPLPKSHLWRRAGAAHADVAFVDPLYEPNSKVRYDGLKLSLHQHVRSLASPSRSVVHPVTTLLHETPCCSLPY